MSKKESVFKMIRFIYKIYPSMFPLIVVCPMDIGLNAVLILLYQGLQKVVNK